MSITIIKKILVLISIAFLSIKASGQLPDTVALKEVTVNSYFNERPYLRIPSSMSVLDTGIFEKMQGVSLVPVFNTVPGVRMEERSPGSYRLSIRGSLLRSPFGVRNVKIYLDEFPLTDAGGNTYLNLLDANIMNRVEVLKGPDGSLFGANSGGVVRITPLERYDNSRSFITNLTGGAYGLFRQNAILQLPFNENTFSFSEATQTYNGYRQNSSLNRKYFQAADRWNYSSKGQIRLFLFYSDLGYLTPGGLTFTEWQNNPRSARPSTAVLPGAEQQNAGVRNKTFFGGLLHEIKLNAHLRQLTSVFGSNTDFENRFITNFETRNENSAGVRTWIEFSNHREGLVNLTLDVGGEMQRSVTQVGNYGNRNGLKDSVQAVDDIKAVQRFGFARFSADLYNRFTIEASASVNDNRFLYSGIEPDKTQEQKRIFKTQFMPRVVMSYLISPVLAWRASVSKGYSPPTFDEFRSSDNIINITLEPELGWNYETGYRLHDKKDRMWWDVSFFYYRLYQAIVRQTNTAGQEFFINAGKTSQPGLESQLTLNLIALRNTRFLRKLELTNSFTWYNFKFDGYNKDQADYSGNFLTGVPINTVITGLAMNLPRHFSLYAQHTYTSKIPLNDANSLYANAFHLVYLKAGWSFALQPSLTCRFFFGVDNLLNESYSLGNDLNAPAGRYYNPAPARNYFAGLRLVFL